MTFILTTIIIVSVFCFVYLLQAKDESSYQSAINGIFALLLIISAILALIILAMK